jgi:hypothetical protein
MKVYAIVDYETEEEIGWVKDIYTAQQIAQRMSVNGFYYAVVVKDISENIKK